MKYDEVCQKYGVKSDYKNTKQVMDKLSYKPKTKAQLRKEAGQKNKIKIIQTIHRHTKSSRNNKGSIYNSVNYGKVFEEEP